MNAINHEEKLQSKFHLFLLFSDQKIQTKQRVCFYLIIKSAKHKEKQQKRLRRQNVAQMCFFSTPASNDKPEDGQKQQLRGRSGSM